MPSTATDRIDGISTSVAVKAPVRVATTGPITAYGLQAVDGVTLSAGGSGAQPDRVLRKDEVNPVNNGIFEVSTTAWRRTKDFDGARDVVQGTLIPVYAGTVNGRTTYQCTTANPVRPGTSSLTFEVVVDVDLAADLADETNPALGAALVGFNSGDTGDVGQSVFSILSERVHLSSWTGTQPDGSVDLSTKVQQALNRFGSRGGLLVCPSGIVRMDAAVTVDEAVIFEGDGKDATKFLQHTAGLDHFIVDTVKSVQFRGMQFYTDVVKSGGAGIKLTRSGASANLHSLVQDCAFYDLYRGVHSDKAYGWNVNHCDFFRSITQSILAQNNNNPDQGDHTVSECWFETATLDHILVQTGGGKYVNNKILGGANGIRMLWPAGALTSDLNITGGSIEGQTSRGIQLTCSNSTGFFTQVNIEGVQLGGQPRCVEVTGITAWLNIINITGCVFYLDTGSGSVCVFLDMVSNGFVGNNTYRGNGSSQVGVQLGSTCTDMVVGDGQYSGIATKVVNSGTNNRVFAVTQTGTVDIVTNSAYGSYYSDTGTITYPLAFNANFPIDISATPVDAGGGVLGSQVGSPGATTCSIRGVGFTSGGTTRHRWVATGVLA